ncbi:hypothetical protein BDA99DRAFT_506102 [Phascolomyces articulosus]|uniref:Uncharacterized protein n=1 Tax=Phascolomyces articulosus TaxID=60185 RepID=A0AAD5PGX4_9FUNG|nr:hypothetical protein BDA99DRAFT_506102 [Phascolomyces articulosus]
MVHRSSSLRQRYYDNDDIYYYNDEQENMDDPYYYYESTRASSSPRRRPSKSKSTTTTKPARRKKRSNSVSGEERTRRGRSNSISNGAGDASSSRSNSVNSTRRRVKNNNNHYPSYEDYYYYNNNDNHGQGRMPWGGGGMEDETFAPWATEVGPMFDSHGFYNDDFMYHNDMMTPWPHGPIAPEEYELNEINNNEGHHASTFSFRPRRQSSISNSKKKKRSSSISSQQTVVDNNNTNNNRPTNNNNVIYISDQPFDDTDYIPQRRNTIQGNGASSSSTTFQNLPHMQQEQQQNDHRSHTIRRRHSLYEQPSASMLMSPMMHGQEPNNIPMTTPSSTWIPPMASADAMPQNFINNNTNANQFSVMNQALLPQQQRPMPAPPPPPLMSQQQPILPPVGGGPMIPPMNQFSAMPMIPPRPPLIMPQPGIGVGMGPIPPFAHQQMMPPILPGLGGPLGLPHPPLPGLGGPLPPPMPPGPLDPGPGGSMGPVSVVPPTIAPTAAATRAVSPVAKNEESKPKETTKPKEASKPKEDPKPRSKSPVKKEETKVEKPKEDPPKAEAKSIPATTAAAAVTGAAAAVVAAAVEKAKESPKAAVAAAETETKKETEEKKEESVAKEIKEESEPKSVATPPKAEPGLRRSRSFFGGWLGGGGGGNVVKRQPVPIYHLSRWDPACVMPIGEAVKPPKISSLAMNTRGVRQPVYPRGHPLNQYLPQVPEPIPEMKNHTLSRRESTFVMAKAEELGMRQYIWCYRPMDPVSAENLTVVWGAFDMRNQYKLDRFLPHVIHKKPIDRNASINLYSQKDLPGRTIVKPMMEIGYNFRRSMSSKALVLEVVCLPNTDLGKLMVRHPKAKDENLDTAPGLSFARGRPGPGIGERLMRSIF